jgi:hypothetical protein
MKTSLLATLCFFFTFTVMAQEDGDYKNYIELSPQFEQYKLQNKQNRLGAFQDADVPVQLHIATENGQPVVNINDVYKVFENINESFKAINIKFVISNDVNYLQSPTYTELDSDAESNQMVTSFKNETAINIYYVKNINFINACGYASVGWSSNGYIVMNGICVNSTTLIHELGHYFSLHHTHDTFYGTALADNSNCETTGDGICDTPADPNLAGQVDYNCNYIGKAKDAKGTAYQPDPSFFMSYAPSLCRKRFSSDQFAKMRFYYDNIAYKFFKFIPYEDFTITQNAPLVIKLGTADTVGVTITLHGNTPVTTTNTITVYLQDNSSKKFYLWQQSINKTWTPGLSTHLKAPINLPTTFQYGEYQLIAEVTNTEEENKYNNTSISKISIYNENIPLPDLRVELNSITDHIIGKEMTIDVNIINDGDAGVGTSSVGQTYFLSKDDKIDAEDIQLAHSYWGSSQFQKPNDKVNYTFGFTLPNNEQYVPHYLICALDLDSYIREKNELNNITAIKINSLIPDDTVLKADLSWGKRTAGKDTLKFRVGGNCFDNDHQVTITNNQFSTNIYLKVGVYLSTDTIFDSSDIFVGIAPNSVLRAPYSSSSNWMSYRLPKNITAGNYHIFYRLDEYNEYFETNEDNNVVRIPAKLTFTKFSDIALNTYEISDTVLVHGEQFKIKTNSSNIGDSLAPTYNLIVFLEPTPYDYLKAPIHGLNAWIYTNTNTQMPIGKTHDFEYSKTITINNDFPEGDYYMDVCTFDHSEGYVYLNNCFVVQNPIKLRFKREDQIPADSSYFVKSTTVGINDQVHLQSGFYPNPSNGIVSFHINENIHSFEVSNLNGKIESNYVYDLDNKRINISNLPPATYIVKAKSSTNVYSFKLVLTK